MRDKKQLTQELVALLPDSSGVTFDTAMKTWWFNLRKNGGMRLTGLGYVALVKDLDLEHYEYHIPDPLNFNQHTILNLDRKLQMPYYIHAVKGIPKKIIFFGAKEAMLTQLYGNLNKFLNNYQ